MSTTADEKVEHHITKTFVALYLSTEPFLAAKRKDEVHQQILAGDACAEYS